MGCPAVDLLVELVERRLDSRAVESVEAHLDGCEACRRAVASLLRDGDEEPESGPLSEDRLVATTGSRSPATSGAPPIRAGDLVDHYEVEALVGGGGMAFVYRARDTFLGRLVALKVLREPLASERAREAFLNEARTTARFQHPNIVTVFGAGETRGHAYLALEYVEGVTLRTKIALEPPSWRDAVAYGLAIVRALAEAHAAGVVHSDLKPNNVLVASSGRVLVVDFGLSLVLCTAGDRVAAGSAPHGGTPLYMAPEQWGGHEPTAASDVWALGVVLFEMLAGKRPFEASSTAALERAIVEQSRPKLPETVRAPGPLVGLTHRCLERDAAARPTLGEIARELQRLARWDDSALGEAPFRGLRAFSTSDAPMFFGRDPEILAALTRLRSEPAMLVLGASGAGKSSFVRAGVLPRLAERGPLLTIEVCPGSEPFVALVRALASVGVAADALPERALETLDPEHLRAILASVAQREDKDVVLFVDQMEEVFSAETPAGTTEAFVRCVLGAATGTAVEARVRVRVIASLREDFLSRVAACRREPLSGLFVLAAPSSAALVDSLVGPVHMLGFRWEPADLPRVMVRAVEGEAAALSLLQFAADQLWESRDRESRTLGEPTYERIGGVGGALTGYADHVLAELGDAGTETARQAFLRLLSAQGTRRIVPRALVVEGLEQGERVVERLVAARLLSVRVSDGRAPEIEVAHESLVVSWPRLRRWVDASREGRAMMVDAEQAALAWKRRGEPESSLWRGRDLVEGLRAVALAERVDPVVLRFLRAGEEAERRARRRRRRLVVVSFVMLVAVAVAALVGSMAFRRERHVAVAERARAERSEADALREAGRAALERGDVADARAKAHASLTLHDDPRTRVLVRSAFAHPLEWARELAGPTLSSDVTADGAIVAAGSGSDVQLLDGRTGRLTRRLAGHHDTVVIVRFAPDGASFVSGAMDGRLLVWSAAGDLVSRLVEDGEGFYAAAFSRDGRWLASGGRRGSIYLFDANTRERRAVLRASNATVNTLVFDAAGERLWSGDNDGAIREWDTRGGVLRRTFASGAAGVQSLALSHDGKTLASGDANGLVTTYDVATASTREQVRAHRSMVHALAFDSSTGNLVSGGHDHALRLWGPREPVSRRDHEAAVWDARFGSSRRLVVTTGQRRIWSWNLERSFEPEPTGHGSYVDAVAFSPDGRVVASGGNDRTVRLWDAATGAALNVLRGHGARVWDVRFSADGNRIASASEDQTVRIWDRAATAELLVLSANGGTVYSVAFGNDERLATVSKDGLLRVWDLRSGALVKSFATGDASGVVRFLPDGVHVATVGTGGVSVWDLDGRRIGRIPGEGAFRGLAVSARKEIASVRADGELRVWSVAGLSEPGRLVGRIAGRLDELTFTPDGSELVATSPDGSVLRWSAGDGAPSRFRAHTGGVSAVATDATGERIVTGGDDGTVRAFDRQGLPAWGRVEALPVREWAVGGSIASTSAEGSVELVSPSGARTTLAVPEAPASKVTALALGGPLVVVGHHDGKVRLWHREVGLLEERRLHGAVLSVEFAPGQRLTARSELGASLDLDLAWLSRDRCALLAELASRDAEIATPTRCGPL